MLDASFGNQSVSAVSGIFGWGTTVVRVWTAKVVVEQKVGEKMETLARK
jgi:hypothetical protein